MSFRSFRDGKPRSSDATGKMSGLFENSNHAWLGKRFYQATVRGIIEKTEAGYDKVQRALVKLRRERWIPYGALVDNTPWQRKPTTYGSPSEAIEDIARFYGKACGRTLIPTSRYGLKRTR